MDVFCRKELKFLIDNRQRQVLTQIFAQRMLPDAYPHSSIRNLYYDTPDFRLIRRSLEKPVYKEKLWLRSRNGNLENGLSYQSNEMGEL